MSPLLERCRFYALSLVSPVELDFDIFTVEENTSNEAFLSNDPDMGGLRCLVVFKDPLLLVVMNAI